MKLRVGLSTCPNDTFAVHAILERKIDIDGFDLDFLFSSVQELNEKLSDGVLDFSKASCHAALHLANTHGVLRAGASMGIGSGPLLLSARAGEAPASGSLVLCPGDRTTGTLLFRCLYPHVERIEHRTFSEIMPALRRGEADFGVVIHEGRFTYGKEGLSLVADLGKEWERVSQGPVPLGVILGRRDLPAGVPHRFHAIFLRSLDYAFAHRDETLETMQRFAQEMEPSVIWSYIDTYVNRYTRHLDDTAEGALRTLERLARDAGALDSADAPLTFFD
jgi:1,4-dihydroxy-6-naphthoate synthase